MAVEHNLTWIQEKVDGTIGSIRRAQLDLHLDECANCRAVLEDLQRIHDAAADLPVLAPPDRAWLQIAGRLRQEGRIRDEAPGTRCADPARRTQPGWRSPRPWSSRRIRRRASCRASACSRPDRLDDARRRNGTRPAADAVNASRRRRSSSKKPSPIPESREGEPAGAGSGTPATIEKKLGIIDQRSPTTARL